MPEFNLVISTILLGVMLLGLGWTAYRLVRRPGSWPLRCVVGILLTFTAQLTLSLFTPDASLSENGPVWVLAAKRIPNIIGSALLLAFFDTAALGIQARTKLRINGLGTAVAVAIALGAAAAAPGGFGQTQAGVIYTVENVYAVISRVACIFAALRYARMAGPRLRRGLKVASVGFVGDIIASLVYVWVCVSYIVTGVYSTTGVIVAGCIVTVSATLDIFGLLTPAAIMRLAASRIWLRHLRDLRRLRPLWTALQQAYPEHVLHPRGGPQRGRGLREVHRRRHRRLVEIRDGLVRISSYLPAETDPDDTEVVARRLRDALQRHSAGEEPPGQHVLPLAMPQRPTLDAEATELTALSRAYELVDAR